MESWLKQQIADLAELATHPGLVGIEPDERHRFKNVITVGDGDEVRHYAVRGYLDGDESLYEGCAAVVRKAARRAAEAGLLDVYDRHKNTRLCSPQDAQAILSSILAVLPSKAPPKPVDAPMTVKEASKRYGIPNRTIYALCQSGQLPHHRIGTGSGRIMIRPADLDRHLEQSRREPRSADSVEDFLFGSPD